MTIDLELTIVFVTTVPDYGRWRRGDIRRLVCVNIDIGCSCIMVTQTRWCDPITIINPTPELSVKIAIKKQIEKLYLHKLHLPESCVKRAALASFKVANGSLPSITFE